MSTIFTFSIKTMKQYKNTTILYQDITFLIIMRLWRSVTTFFISLSILNVAVARRSQHHRHGSSDNFEGQKLRDPTTATPTLPQNFYRENQERQALKCAQLGDGNYGFGCSERFWICRGNTAYLMHCPAGLYFNPLRNQCQYIQNVDLCQNAHLRDSLVPQRAVDEFNCTDKVDGLYTKGYCDGNYIRCVNGSLYNHHCPADLEFDDKKIACVKRKDVQHCRTVRRMSFNANQKKNRTPCNGDECSKDSDREVDCSILPDGSYPPTGSLCKNFFYKCTSGQSTFMKCPKGLYYSTETQQCDFMENINECEFVFSGGVKVKQTTIKHFHVKPHPIPPAENMSCAGKDDGFYTENPCTPAYFQCSSEFSFGHVCPSGFVFEILSKTCVAFDKCRKLKLSKPEATPTFKPTTVPVFTTTSSTHTVLQTTTAPAQSSPVDNFCVNKADGTYPLGCSNEYYVCSNGQAYKMKCAGSTVFDVETNTCDARTHVTACGGSKPVTEMPTQGSVVIKDTFCEEKNDGVYATGCTNEYYVCNGGYAFKNTCPPGLVYSVEDQACLYKENVLTCNGSPTQKVETTPAPTVQFDPFCSGKTDGYYSEKCSDVFYHCMGGYANKQRCPIGLFFDLEYEQCNHKEEIKACGGSKLPETTAATTTTTTTTTTRPIPTEQADTFCSGKPDGYYTKGCSSEYYACTGGYTFKMYCIDGTFYDQTENRCFVKEESPACGGKLPQPTPKRPNKVLPVDTFCSGKEDGYYSDKCSTTFYYCEKESGEKQTCPTGLFFDVDFNMCDWKDKITACGGQKTTPPPLVTVTYPPVVVDTFCQGKADGYYAQGCAQEYYSCVGEVTHKMYCQDGLFYDSKENECLPKDEASTCGGTKKVYDVVPDQSTSPDRGVIDTFCVDKADGFYDFQCSSDYYSCFSGFGTKQTCPTGTKFDIQSQECNFPTEIAACGGSTSPKVEQPVFAPIEVNPFCVGKENGYYALECSRKYYSCLDEIAVQMNCPAGLVYDDKFKQCLTPEEAPACGGAGPTEFTPLPTMPSDVGVVDTFCQGKTDGYYSDECSNWFYNCNNQYGNKVLCPSGLMFDKTTNACEVKKYAVSCGGQPRPKPTVYTMKEKLPNDPFCVGKGNGYYANGCSSMYYGCNNGVTQKMSCPMGTFFDDEINKCSLRDEVPACGGTRPSKVADNIVALLQPSTYCEGKPSGRYAGTSSLNEHLIVVSPRPVVKNVCDNKADGIYCKGCARECMKCQSGQAVKFTCAEGLYYDEETKSCTTKDTIPVCGGTRPKVTAAPVKPTESSQSLDVVHGKPCDMKKWSKPFGQACGVEFYACHETKVIRLVCPQNQKFDQNLGRCRMRHQYPLCWQTKPKLNDYDNNHKLQNQGQKIQQNGRDEQKSTKTDKLSQDSSKSMAQFIKTTDEKEKKYVVDVLNDTKTPFVNEHKTRFCNNVKYGIYHKNCSPYYIVCSASKRNYFSSCPEGKFWSGKSFSCEPKEHMEGCVF
uniref:Chondroitin proteoglycan 2 n=1 Tax=Strongyloides venezuelensis TaxID=75913 RepID=A0A0K0FFZ5_STRVS